MRSRSGAAAAVRSVLATYRSWLVPVQRFPSRSSNMALTASERAPPALSGATPPRAVMRTSPLAVPSQRLESWSRAMAIIWAVRNAGGNPLCVVPGRPPRQTVIRANPQRRSVSRQQAIHLAVGYAGRRRGAAIEKAEHPGVARSDPHPVIGGLGDRDRQEADIRFVSRDAIELPVPITYGIVGANQQDVAIQSQPHGGYALG